MTQLTADLATDGRPAAVRAEARPANDVSAVDTGLLLIRLCAGLLLVGHGTQKLFGWFGGGGIEGTGQFFAMSGYTPGRFFAVLAGLTETLGGIGLAVGLFTPLAAAMVAGTMINAASMHWPKGLWNAEGGYELPLVLGFVAAGLAFTGPGSLAVDRWLPWGKGRILIGLASVTLALIAGVITLIIKNT